MGVVATKKHKTLYKGFSNEIQRTVLTYDFAAGDSGATGTVSALATLGEDLLILKVVAVVRTACAGTGETTDLGHTDDTDYFTAAMAVANMTKGAVLTSASTSISLVLAADKQILLTRAAAALTAGKIVVEVWYKGIEEG